MIVFGVCVGTPEKYERFAAPGIAAAREPDSEVVVLTGQTSIFEAYNTVLERARAHDDLEAVVLLHEDLQILDGNFCARVRDRFRSDPDVAVIGVHGSTGAPGLSWWKGSCHGRLGETRGFADYGGGTVDVDQVDGLLVVLSPWAARELSFDAERYRGFHGYDGDICAAARAAGQRVVVEPLDVYHHSKTGYGDREAFERADATYRSKWGVTRSRRLPPHRLLSPTLREDLAAVRRSASDLLGDVAVLAGRAVRNLAPGGDDVRWLPLPDGTPVPPVHAGLERDPWVLRVRRRRRARVLCTWVLGHVPEGALAVVGDDPDLVVAARAEGLDAVLLPNGPADWLTVRPGFRFDGAVVAGTLDVSGDPEGLLEAVAGAVVPGGFVLVEVATRAGDPCPGGSLNVPGVEAATLRALAATAGLEVRSLTAISDRPYDRVDEWWARRTAHLQVEGRPPGPGRLRAVFVRPA